MRSCYRSDLAGPIVALSLALVVSTTTTAQTSSTNSQSQSSSTNRASSQGQDRGQGDSVDDDLHLSLDQKQRIAAVMDDHDRQVGAVRDDASLSPDQKQQKADQIRDVVASKIKAILTPEQLRKLTTIQERINQQQHGDQSRPQEPTK